MHVAYLHLAFSVFMFHLPSLLLPHGHIDSTFPSAPSSSSFTRSKSVGQAVPDSRKSDCREFLRVNKIRRIRNLMRDNFFDSIKATVEQFLPGHFSVFTYFSFGAMYRTFSLHFAQFCFAGVDMLGLWTWSRQLRRLHARYLTWSAPSLSASCTALDHAESLQKCTTIIISHRLSGVSRVRCPVCPGPHPCFHVLTTSSRHPDSEKPFFFFDGLKKF